MTFLQFCKCVEQLQNNLKNMEYNDNDREEESDDELIENDDNVDGERNLQFNDEDDEKYKFIELFDELKHKTTGMVSIKKFKSWHEIKDSLTDGHITTTQLDDALKKFGVVKDLSYEQFHQCLDELFDSEWILQEDKDTINDGSNDEDGDGVVDDETNDPLQGTDDDEDTAEDTEESDKELFDQLRNKKTNKITVKNFIEVFPIEITYFKNSYTNIFNRH
jgi:hypothetical protein